MPDKRRMHTLAASYLEPFAVIEGRRTPGVWRYSRSDREPVLIGIYDAAVRKDIYAFEDEAGQRTTGIEDTLTEVEGRFCEARQLLTGSGLLNLNQRMAIATFIAFQLLRTPRSLQLHRDLYSRVIKDEVLSLALDKERFHDAMADRYESEDACEAARHRLLSGGWHFEADAFTGLYAMMHWVPSRALWVTLMNWTAYITDGSYRLMTSDNPVTLWTERAVAGQVGTEVGLGFSDPAMRLSFPVTPLVSLVAEHTAFSLSAINADDPESVHARMRAWHPEFRYQEAPLNSLKVLNHATVTNADHYVYSHRDGEAEQFLARYFFNRPAPVRRYDLKPVGSPS